MLQEQQLLAVAPDVLSDLAHQRLVLRQLQTCFADLRLGTDLVGEGDGLVQVLVVSAQDVVLLLLACLAQFAVDRVDAQQVVEAGQAGFQRPVSDPDGTQGNQQYQTETGHQFLANTQIKQDSGKRIHNNSL